MVTLSVGRPGAELAAPQQPPPMRLRLWADFTGNMTKMQLNQRGFGPGEWGALRKHMIHILREDRGPTQVRDPAEIVLDFDDKLHYRHLINAITACSAYADENGQLVSLVQSYEIVSPENMDSFLSSFAEQEEWEKKAGSKPPGSSVGRPDDRVKVPKSELTRTPDGPYDEPLLLQMDIEGYVIVYDDVFPMEVMPNIMLRERRNLVKAGASAGDATIIIRAHEHCPAVKIRQLIGICAALQFKRFVLRTRLTPPP
jgi:hypothetical protein